MNFNLYKIYNFHYNTLVSGKIFMKNLIKTFFFVTAICVSTLVYSQVETQPVQPPWFFYWPTENPDNFQYSELGNSSLTGGSTFQRRSNVEVNKRISEEEEISAPTAPEVPTTIDIEIDTAENSLASRPPSSSQMFKWVDDEGVVHVTNDQGSIPEKYRDQIKN